AAPGGPARAVRAPPLAALPGLPRRRGDVHAAVVVLGPSAPAPCGVGHVRPALRCVPLPGRVRARARRPPWLPRLRLADHGPGAEHPADPARPLLAVALASQPHPAAGPRRPPVTAAAAAVGLSPTFLQRTDHAPVPRPPAPCPRTRQRKIR